MASSRVALATEMIYKHKAGRRGSTSRLKQRTSVLRAPVLPRDRILPLLGFLWRAKKKASVWKLDASMRYAGQKNGKWAGVKKKEEMTWSGFWGLCGKEETIPKYVTKINERLSRRRGRIKPSAITFVLVMFGNKIRLVSKSYKLNTSAWCEANARGGN